MRCLVDAQLPPKLADALREWGWDAVHTRSLPLANATSDEDIGQLADRESRLVITKDADFLHSHRLRGCPRSLLLVATGNLGNRELLKLFEQHREAIEAFAAIGRPLRLDRTGVSMHLDPVES